MSLAVSIYLLATLVIVLFQLALALGAPWGHLAMGGKYPGSFPANMRIAAIVQAGILVGLAYIVFRHANSAPQTAPQKTWLIWLPVAFAAIATVLNAITPSAAERKLWLPVAITMLITSVWAALSAQAAP